MRRLAITGLVLIAASCFDPLYELGPDRSWAVCCVAGAIDTCECADPATCAFQLTACARNTCVERGSCGQGGAGGSTPDAGLSTGGGAGGGGGGAGGGTPVTFFTYEPCCKSGQVATCECPNGECSAAPFRACARGRCAPKTAACD